MKIKDRTMRGENKEKKIRIHKTIRDRRLAIADVFDTMKKFIMIKKNNKNKNKWFTDVSVLDIYIHQ
jgi:hypothetical protein